MTASQQSAKLHKDSVINKSTGSSPAASPQQTHNSRVGGRENKDTTAKCQWHAVGQATFKVQLDQTTFNVQLDENFL